MTRIDTVMIGGGPAGLAMSRCLSDFGIDHVVVEQADLDGDIERPAPFQPPWPAARTVPSQTVLSGVKTIVWATGFKRAYPWLRLPVFDAEGEIRHRAGVTPHPGLYVLGMHLQRRRNSGFIDWMGEDAAMLAEPIVCRGGLERAAATRARKEDPWSATSLT